MTSTTVVEDGSGPVAVRPGVLAMPRRRGNLIGILLILLGLWGGLSPLIGPWFGYHIDDEQAWILTWDRLWLTTVPGAAALIGGLLLVLSRDRLTASLGAWLALAGGVWFVVGPSVSALWSSDLSASGIGRGNTAQRVLVQLLSFYGLGAAITALASFALARVLIRSERDVARLQDEAAAATEAARLREQREQLEREREQLRASAVPVAAVVPGPAAVPGALDVPDPTAASGEALPPSEPRTAAPVTAPEPATSEPSTTVYRPIADPGPDAPVHPMLPGQRPVPALSGEQPAASETDDYYRSTPTEPGNDPDRR